MFGSILFAIIILIHISLPHAEQACQLASSSGVAFASDSTDGAPDGNGILGCCGCYLDKPGDLSQSCSTE